MYDRQSVTELYGERYAEMYDEFYLHPWPEKHQVNLKILQNIMKTLPLTRGRWLDICCGQAWHFSQIATSLDKIGVDLSEQQLQRASARNPTARWIRADITQLDFRRSSFALATCFWGAYCYLDDDAAIASLFERVSSWIEPGGTIYIEVLPPENLASFNESAFAGRTGFKVKPRTPDCRAWSYEDGGGEHLMRSPNLDTFVTLFEIHFEQVRAMTGGFMVHLVCKNRRLGE